MKFVDNIPPRERGNRRGTAGWIVTEAVTRRIGDEVVVYARAVTR